MSGEIKKIDSIKNIAVFLDFRWSSSVKDKENNDKLDKYNPYGVQICLVNWAGSGDVVNFGTTICFASLSLKRSTLFMVATIQEKQLYHEFIELLKPVLFQKNTAHLNFIFPLRAVAVLRKIP